MWICGHFSTPKIGLRKKINFFHVCPKLPHIIALCTNQSVSVLAAAIFVDIVGGFDDMWIKQKMSNKISTSNSADTCNFMLNKAHIKINWIILGGVKIQLCWAWSWWSPRHWRWKSAEKIYHCEFYSQAHLQPQLGRWDSLIPNFFNHPTPAKFNH